VVKWGILPDFQAMELPAGWRYTTHGTPYPLIEVTSSGITQAFPGAVETSPQRVGALYGAVNFGTIAIDWWERRLTLQVRGENGEAVRTLAVSFEEISRAK
jgi:hypothetical protein